ncbi:Gfo/Idh/MocA family oxidoreductase [Candidatus Sumerlaeota bacterium]|nr:Gfo/Idh/MocA family oxidoreductase [Candidatus Sumerlaeota bacterium]
MTRRARNLRAAVVGAGLMGRWHARELTRLGHELAAVVDTSEEAAHDLARAHDGARWFASLSDALLNDSFDVVHICTPLETHATLSTQALESGASVLVEKPLAADVATTQRLLDLASSKGLLLCPVHQFVFQQGIEQSLRNVSRLQGILHIDYIACSAGAAGQSDAEHERIALEILPHPLSLLARFVSDNSGDYEWNVLRTGPGEIRCFGSARGTALSLMVSMHGRPTLNYMRLVGNQGTIHTDLFHGFSVTERGTVSRFRKILHPFAHSSATLLNAGQNLARRTIEQEQAYPGLRTLIRSFYSALHRRKGPPLSAEQVLFVAAERDRLMKKLAG